MGYTLEQLDTNTKQDLIGVILQKKNGEIDLDWSEIKDEFELDISADHLRRVGVGVQLTSDAGMLNPPHLDNIDAPTLDMMAVEHNKMRTLRNQVNEIYRSQARSELLRETVEKAIEELPPMPDVAPAAPAPQYETEAVVPDRALVLAMGDFHFGAEIDERGLYGEPVNVYDEHVFQKRMSSLLAQAVAIVHKEHLTEAYVFLVGDLLDGILRQNQLMRLQYGLVESTIKLSEYLAKWLNEFSKSCDHLHVAACTGNHSEFRPLKAKSREFEEENLEKIILWYLAARLAGNDRIVVDTDCVRMKLVSVAGYNFLLLHGDDSRNVREIARDTVNLYGTNIDYFVCGHLHKEEEVGLGSTPDGRSTVIRVPSICGMDSYARSKGLGGRAGATAMVIEGDYGRRCVYPIRL